MSLSPHQFGAFTREHAPKQAVAWRHSAGTTGGVSRDQPKARLVTSKPFPMQVGNMAGLMDRLAPGSVSKRNATRKLN